MVYSDMLDIALALVIVSLFQGHAVPAPVIQRFLDDVASVRLSRRLSAGFPASICSNA